MREFRKAYSLLCVVVEYAVMNLPSSEELFYSAIERIRFIARNLNLALRMPISDDYTTRGEVEN